MDHEDIALDKVMFSSTQIEVRKYLPTIKTDSNIIFTYTNFHNYVKDKMINKRTRVDIRKEMIELYQCKLQSDV